MLRCEAPAGAEGAGAEVAAALAGLAVAAWLWRRNPPVAGALGLAHVASAAFHDRPGPVTGWADGAGVALTAAALAASASGRTALREGAVAAVVVVTMTAPPALRAPVTAGLVLAAVATLARAIPPARLAAGVGILGAGLIAWWAGLPDGGWCGPGGALPVHAAWHLAAAVGVATVAPRLDRAGTRRRR